MSSGTPFEFLKSILLTFVEVEEDQLQEQTLLADLGIDSLDYVQIQVETRKRYGIIIDFRVLSSGSIVTLGDFAAYMDSLILQQAQVTP